MRFLSFLVLIIVALVVVFFVVKSRVPDMMANNLSKKLGVSVSIDSIDFGMRKIEIDHVEIGNPRGYSLPKAFSAEEIELHAPITEYFKEDLVIDLIEVDNIYLGIEFDSTKGTEGNWKTIMRNFQQNAGLDKKDDREILVKTIVFKNIETDLLFRDQGGNPRRLPKIGRIELHNISTEGGIPTDQLMGTILAQMIKEVFIQQNMGNLLQEVIQSPGGAVDSLLQPFKGLFNAAPQEAKDKPIAA